MPRPRSKNIRRPNWSRGCRSSSSTSGGRGIARTGGVGTLRGSLPSDRAIALHGNTSAGCREQKDFPDASRYLGRVHACGHDGHIAMRLGVAKYVVEARISRGRSFIFHPAEENESGTNSVPRRGSVTCCAVLNSVRSRPLFNSRQKGAGILAFTVLRRYAWLPQRLKGAGHAHIIVDYRNRTTPASLTQNCNGGPMS